MQGIEFVNDQESKTPLDPALFAQMHETTKELGCLFGKGGIYGNVFRVQPPMCMTEADMDFTLESLDYALKEINSK